MFPMVSYTQHYEYFLSQRNKFFVLIVKSLGYYYFVDAGYTTWNGFLLLIVGNGSIFVSVHMVDILIRMKRFLIWTILLHEMWLNGVLECLGIDGQK